MNGSPLKNLPKVPSSPHPGKGRTKPKGPNPFRAPIRAYPPPPPGGGPYPGPMIQRNVGRASRAGMLAGLMALGGGAGLLAYRRSRKRKRNPGAYVRKQKSKWRGRSSGISYYGKKAYGYAKTYAKKKAWEGAHQIWHTTAGTPHGIKARKPWNVSKRAWDAVLDGIWSMQR